MTMPDIHSKRFPPSSMARIIHCTGSADANARAPSIDSVYTKEGTDAHSVCEWLLKQATGQECTDPRENLDYYDETMLFCAEGYRDYCMEALSSAGNEARLLVEQRVSLEKWVEGCFGTADCIIVSDSALHLIDFKFGQGVLVEAKENAQLMCYGLGAVATLGDLYDFEDVRLSIYQPRRSSVDTWTTTRTDLLTWADEVLVPAAQAVISGKVSYHCGSWCRFCAIAGECREQAREMAKDYEDPATLDADEIAELLPQLDDISAWVKAVQEKALTLALQGTKLPGYKVVAGRSRRIISDEDNAAKAIEAAGYDPYDRKLKTITALEKEMGRATFGDVVGKYIVKPEGAPTLAPESDRREPIEILGSAAYE